MSDPRLPPVGIRSVRLPGCLLPSLLLALLALPIVEIAVLIAAVRRFGLGWTLLACVVTAVAGSMVARWQGAMVLRRAQEALARGELPGAAVLDGAMLLVAGVLLVAPGFVTDAIGLLLLLPPTRALVKLVLRRSWRRRRPPADPPAGAAAPGPAGRPGAESWRKPGEEPEIIDVTPE